MPSKHNERGREFNPENRLKGPQKERLTSSKRPFSGTMLVFGGVYVFFP